MNSLSHRHRLRAALGRFAPMVVLLLTLAACANDLRQINRSILETVNPNALRTRSLVSGSGGPLNDCFNPDLGLLYSTSAANCAAGYQRIDSEAAAQIRTPPPPQAAEPAETATNRNVAAPPFCYDDKLQMLNERSQCEPWERPVTLAEAERLQRTTQSRNLWCYYSNQRILYRAQSCRPGDKAIAVNEADKLWDTLPAGKRPKERPLLAAGVARPATGVDSLPAPPMQAAPRRGVEAQTIPK